MALGNVQLGKQGITNNFFITLENMFKKHDVIKIHVLKSARGEGKEAKEIVRKFSEEILDKLGRKYTKKIIGFTIVIKKWRKPRK